MPFMLSNEVRLPHVLIRKAKYKPIILLIVLHVAKAHSLDERWIVPLLLTRPDLKVQRPLHPTFIVIVKKARRHEIIALSFGGGFWPASVCSFCRL